MATVLDGRTRAKEIEEDLKQRVAAITREHGERPVLATILVGNDPASQTYVRMKGNACERIGMESRRVTLPAET
ncbi:MAG: tetrahydrofolate dehydrogenase/cyclohydrolase catalytic domain-containing protein, partial [Fibrobacterota bacterium]